jgi:hypothetical protein
MFFPGRHMLPGKCTSSPFPTEGTPPPALEYVFSREIYVSRETYAFPLPHRGDSPTRFLICFFPGDVCLPGNVGFGEQLPALLALFLPSRGRQSEG